MNYTVAAYGLRSEQVSHLEAALPDGYAIALAECVTDLLVTNAVCSIIDVSELDKYAINSLIAYYMDVGDRLDETVVWVGDAELPELPSFVRCESFLELLTELESILTRAKVRYDTMQMYGDAYTYLPKHAIEESMETDVYAALCRKYGNNPDSQIIKLVRREWQTVLEAGAAEELAAVYELIRWLKRNSYPFRAECKAVFRFILYLLDIAEDAPSYPADYDPLRQKDHLEIGYVFCLPEYLKSRIEQWQKHHWLITERGTFGNIRFIFRQPC